jgi:hypothetical protein
MKTLNAYDIESREIERLRLRRDLKEIVREVLDEMRIQRGRKGKRLVIERGKV